MEDPRGVKMSATSSGVTRRSRASGMVVGGEREEGGGMDSGLGISRGFGKNG